MKAALYARTSTRDREQNPETQLLPLREWATRNGYPIVEYVDQASAADFARRTAWARLREDIRLRQVDVVAVLRLDRAFRMNRTPRAVHSARATPLVQTAHTSRAGQYRSRLLSVGRGGVKSPGTRKRVELPVDGAYRRRER